MSARTPHFSGVYTALVTPFLKDKVNYADLAKLVEEQVVAGVTGVVAVGTTTVVAKTTTDATGAQTTEQLPRTLFTLGVTQEQAQKITFGAATGELSFGLLNKDSDVVRSKTVDDGNLFQFEK